MFLKINGNKVEDKGHIIDILDGIHKIKKNSIGL